MTSFIESCLLVLTTVTRDSKNIHGRFLFFKKNVVREEEKTVETRSKFKVEDEGLGS